MPLGITKGNTSKTGGKAEAVAAVQAVALSKADLATVGTTTCAAEREKVVATYKAAFDAGTTFDVSGAAVKEISYDGTTAVVELAGAKIVAAGVSTAVPPSFAKAIEEGGTWVLCGAAPAPAVAAADAPATGAITADYGFRPSPNGFAFEAKGYTIDPQFQIGQREVYLPELKAGKIDLFPEYSGNLLVALDPKTTATSGTEVAAALKTALPAGLTALTAATASDQDSYNVTKATADKYSLVSIADLSKVPAPIKVAANSELQKRSYGMWCA